MVWPLIQIPRCKTGLAWLVGSEKAIMVYLFSRPRYICSRIGRSVGVIGENEGRRGRIGGFARLIGKVGRRKERRWREGFLPIK